LEVGKLMRDSPMSSVDKAVWWIEYILRHEANHLQPRQSNDSWIQKRLLDVWFVIIIFSLLIVYTLRLLVSLVKPHRKSKTD